MENIKYNTELASTALNWRHEERGSDLEVPSSEVGDWPSRPFTIADLEQAIRTIDPKTTEVTWWYADIDDPYGIVEGRPTQVGREYFARSPEGGPWIWFGDLPASLSDALWEKHKSKLAFPAGLFPTDQDQ